MRGKIVQRLISGIILMAVAVTVAATAMPQIDAQARMFIDDTEKSTYAPLLEKKFVMKRGTWETGDFFKPYLTNFLDGRNIFNEIAIVTDEGYMSIIRGVEAEEYVFDYMEYYTDTDGNLHWLALENEYFPTVEAGMDNNAIDTLKRYVEQDNTPRAYYDFQYTSNSDAVVKPFCNTTH